MRYLSQKILNYALFSAQKFQLRGINIVSIIIFPSSWQFIIIIP